MSWQSFISGSVSTWTKKGAASLGLGLISYVGFEAAKAQISGAISDLLTGIPSDAYQLFALAGFIDAIGVWLGALTAAVAFHSFGRLGVLGGSPV